MARRKIIDLKLRVEIDIDDNDFDNNTALYNEQVDSAIDNFIVRADIKITNTMKVAVKDIVVVGASVRRS